MKSAYEILKPYAIVGWLITEKGYTIEEVNKLDGFEIVMLDDEFKRFYAEKCNR